MGSVGYPCVLGPGEAGPVALSAGGAHRVSQEKNVVNLREENGKSVAGALGRPGR